MKRTLIIFVAVICLIVFLASFTVNAKVVDSGTWYNVHWTLDSDGVLTLSGDGRMESSSSHNYDWGKYADKVKTVIVQDGLKSIGHSAFFGMKKLTSAYIADSVERIEVDAFSNCEKLTTIVLPNNLKVIEESTFLGCTSLESIYFPESIEMIDRCAFAYCSALKELHFAENGKLHTIKEGAFKQSGIEVLHTPSSLRTIEWTAFEQCEQLRAVYLNAGLETVKTRAFINCWYIKEIYIAETIQEIGDHAFYGCNWFEKATIYAEEGLALLNDQEDLKTVVIDGNLNTLDALFPWGESWENVTLELGATTTGIGAFHHNTSVTELVFPDGLSYIARLFNYAAIERLIIPASVTTLDQGAFSEGTAVRELIFWGDAPVVKDTNHKPIKIPVNDVTVYYPANNPTWTQEKKEQFGENAVWIAVDCNGQHQPIDTLGLSATCERAGWSNGSRCFACGTILEEQTEVNALGHDFGEWIELFAPTDGYYGMMERTCTRCHYVEQKRLDALNPPETKPEEPERTDPIPTEPVVTEPVATEPKPTEPIATEPKPTEPIATEPKPTEPVVTEPVVTEPVVTEPVVTEPVATKPIVTEPVATEPEVTEPKPTEPKPTEPKPTEVKPTEPKPTEPGHAAPVSVDLGPVIIAVCVVGVLAAAVIFFIKKRS